MAEGLKFLHGLVVALLGKETPAHTRAAMAVLGAVRCPGFPGLGEAGENSAPVADQKRGPGDDALSLHHAGSERGQETDLAALSRLLDLLCQVFDCAWASEGRPSLEEAAAQPRGFEPLGRRDPGAPGITPVFGFPQVPLLPSEASRGSATGSETSSSAPVWGHVPSTAPKPLLQVEAGVGHRVLIQVLQVRGQVPFGISASDLSFKAFPIKPSFYPSPLHIKAWKSLREKGGGGVLEALKRTGWWTRIKAAGGHDRRSELGPAIFNCGSPCRASLLEKK